MSPLASLLCRARFVGGVLHRIARDRRLTGETWHTFACRLHGSDDDSLLRLLEYIHLTGEVCGEIGDRLAEVVAEWREYRGAVVA